MTSSQPIAVGNTFEALFDDHPQPMWAFETSGLRIVAANQAAEVQYGYTQAEFLALSPLDLRPPEDRQLFLDSLNQPAPTLTNPAVGRHQRKDGTLFDVEIAVIETLAMNQRLRLVIVNDVTERNRIRHQLTLADVRYRHLVEDASDTVFTVDQNGRFLSVNVAGERLTGYSHDELLRLSIFDLLAPEHRERSRRAWMSGSGSVVDVELRTRLGDRLIVQVSCSKSVSQGRVEFQGIARNVTERIKEARFDDGRRKVLELLTRGETLPKVLSHICELLEDRWENVLCSIIVPANGNSDLVVWSTAWSNSEGTIASRDSRLKKTRLLAHNERNGITMNAVSESAVLLDGLLASSYPYSWTISTHKVPEQAAAEIAVYRQNHSAPTDQEASILRKIADLIDMALEHDRLTSQLRHQADHDALTGLPNRVSFRKHLTDAIAAAGNAGSLIGLVYIDLDDFNLVNDAEGHLAGDKLLGKVAARLKDQLGDSTMLARTGGDEFCIVLRDIEREEDVTSLARRILKAMRKPFELDGRDQFLNLTMGISLFPRDGITAGALIQCADVALYRRKAEGKGGYQTYDPEMARTASRRQEIQNRLHHAVEHPEEFTLLYQPQVQLASGNLSGFEALLRWTAPGLDKISPAEFIPIAEESGLILRIGRWTLHQVCRCARQWLEERGIPGRIAVNVSARQFGQTNFIDFVAAALQDSGLDPSKLELELTETVLMRNFADSARKVTCLRQLGVAVSIDDFGTGYSSLSYLEQLPVDTLKIDASFTRRIAPGLAPPALVQAIIGLAHNLGMNVIAEGIESACQMEILQSLGCDKGQGYWISQPVTADSAFGMLLDPGCLRKNGPLFVAEQVNSHLHLLRHPERDAAPTTACA